MQITNLTGNHFLQNASVILRRKGWNDIEAKSEKVRSSRLITCTFTVPRNAVKGKWDVVVENPDGREAVKEKAFAVR